LDLFDLNHGQLLPMALLLMVTFAALHLPDDDLVAAFVFDDVGNDFRAIDNRGSNAELAIPVNEQYAVERHRLTDFDAQAFDFDFVAGRDAILFSACL